MSSREQIEQGTDQDTQTNEEEDDAHNGSLHPFRTQKTIPKKMLDMTGLVGR